jgi:hypothetical protein
MHINILLHSKFRRRIIRQYLCMQKVGIYQLINLTERLVSKERLSNNNLILCLYANSTAARSRLQSRIIKQMKSEGVEAGSNTSTVTLRVVGGDEKGSLKSETVKDGRESQGTRNKERLR